MPRLLATTIVVLTLCLNATATFGCDDVLDLPQPGSEASLLQDVDDPGGSHADCCAQCYCCVRIMSAVHRVREFLFPPVTCDSESPKVRLVDGHLAPPYHPPQVIA